MPPSPALRQAYSTPYDFSDMAYAGEQGICDCNKLWKWQVGLAVPLAVFAFLTVLLCWRALERRRPAAPAK